MGAGRKALAPDGHALLNADDPYVDGIAEGRVEITDRPDGVTSSTTRSTPVRSPCTPGDVVFVKASSDHGLDACARALAVR